MSGIVAALPRGLMKNSIVGAILSLVSYIVLQFLGSLLICYEVVGEEGVYLLVCVSAGVSAFLGCGYSAMRGGNGRVLSASAVVLVFLSLTIAVAFLTGGVESVGLGLTGVGGAMAAGGLAAALVTSVIGNKSGSGRGKVRKRSLKR